jgi:hypothetical protein
MQFPTALDSLTDPVSSSSLSVANHASVHSEANAAIEALEAKVGVDSSAVVTSLDYLLKNASSSNPGHVHTVGAITGLTATVTELNKLSGVTSSASELNILDGVTATASEINQLDDVVFGGTDSDDIVTIGGTQTLTNKGLTTPTLTNPVLNGNLTGTAVLDEDDFASDSNTKVPTQQSVKAWVQAQLGTASTAMLKSVYDADADDIVDEAAAIEGIGSAGNSKYYGTDGSGTAGFHDVSTGTVDTSGTPVANDFAKFTDANTIEGRSYAEVLSDLSGQATGSFSFNSQPLTWVGNISSVGTTWTLDGATNANLILDRAVSTSSCEVIYRDSDTEYWRTGMPSTGPTGTGDYIISDKRNTIEHIRCIVNGNVKLGATLDMNTNNITNIGNVGIADNDLVEIDHASVADNDYAKFTANGLEGRSYAEVRTDLNIATQTIVLTAGGGFPSTTSGCGGPTKTEYGTNDVDMYSLDFDTSSDEFAQWTIAMPANWDAGTITARFYWTAASGSGTVKFYLQGRSYANDDAIDQAMGTAVGVEDTLITAADVHITDATAAITITGATAGELVQLRVYRDVSEDTLDVDAKLLAVKIEYGIT